MKACIFDLDGTLTDTLSSIALYGNTALEKFGLPAIDINKYKYFLGNGRDILIHRMLKFNNADTDKNYINVGNEYDRLYHNNAVGLTTAFDGIYDMLDSLKVMNIKIAVLSNKPHDVTLPVVNAIFGNTFDIVYGQRSNVRLKPAPDGAIIICRELNILPENCFFIGDTNNDILTGKNAHMKSIGVLWGFREQSELLEAGADYIVSSPDEIVKIVTKK